MVVSWTSSLPGALQALPEGTRPAPSQAVSLARRLSSSRYAWSRKKSGHFSSKGTVARVHPRLGNLFGKVHDPGLKPEGLVETVSNLVEMVSMAFSLTRLHWSAPYVTGGDALLSRLLAPREAAAHPLELPLEASI
jgi:hypothetical protein